MKIFSKYEERLDKFLSEELSDLSREKIKDYIKNGRILVGGKVVKPSYKLSLGEEIYLPEDLFQKPQVYPEKMDIRVIFENEDYAIIDKEGGVIVHPAGNIYSGTLVNGLLYRFSSLSDGEGEDRPGIVHRLDKDTTGLLVITKTNDSYFYFKDLFQKRQVDKVYYTIVHGNFEDLSGEIKTFYGRDENNRKKMAVKEEGREAITFFEVLDQVPGYSLLRVKIKTGRTHQIRVHLSYINHPVLGDPLYGGRDKKFDLDHQLLHCGELGFVDRSGFHVTYKADVHPDFKKYQKILQLGGDNVFKN